MIINFKLISYVKKKKLVNLKSHSSLDIKCTRLGACTYISYRTVHYIIIFLVEQVTYNATGFIEKNRETLNINFISLMQNSHNWLINDLFDDRQDRETR